ncbi:MAG: WS/DGAT/MGAT family O-acyltransferase [Jatrophihabitantaceae bacterium]
MSERLSSADVSFFYLETTSSPQHVGGIAIFAAPAPAGEGPGFDYERLVGLLEERIALVPRYRQKMRTVPGNLAHPVWVDDANFDITYHVRRSALPRPGTDAQLLEFCARVQSRLLDRDRPLWEMYLIEGLSSGRVVIMSKTHHSMVDGIDALDITQVLLDESPEPRRSGSTLWMPQPEPSSTQLVLEALAGVVHRPAELAEAVRLDARSTSGWLAGVCAGVGSAAASLVRSGRVWPLSAAVGEQRRLAVARTRLEDYRQVRRVQGGTVNDVMIATVAGALRGWLLSRGQTLGPAATVRALVPVSVREAVGPTPAGPDDCGSAGAVRATLVDLPVGEAEPLRRLAQIRNATGAQQQSGRSVGADALVALSGFAPPTLHSLGARAANGLTRRMFDLVVANVPGPQHPLYAAGARMTEIFPVLPLGRGHAVSIGLTSYDGGVYFGVNADRDAVPDVQVLADLVIESLAELVAASPQREVAVAPSPGFSLRQARAAGSHHPFRAAQEAREPQP